MKKFLASFVLTLVFFFSVLFPAQSESFNLSWPLEGELGVKFGEKYRVGGEEKTHFGIDILASEGTEIKSPVNGEVSFAGQVAGRLAVTISFEGYKVSLSPLQEILVSKGEKVKAGKAIGKLAAEGDYSSSEPHLHLSLRDPSGKYLDPLTFLPPLKTKEQTQEEPQLQLQEQPVNNEVVTNPERGGELVGNPTLNQLSDQAGASQPEKDIQTKSSPALQPAPTWQKTSQMSLAKESSILQREKPVESFKTVNLKKEARPFRSSPGAKPKNKDKPSLTGFYQHQPIGLTELTQRSTGIIPGQPAQLENGNTNLNLGNLVLLSWAFFVLPLTYFLFCLAGKGNSNLCFSLAEV